MQQNVWFKVNADQRDKLLRKFYEAKMSKTEIDTDSPSCSVVTPESVIPAIRPVRISADLVELGITSAPMEILHSISNKAEKLLRYYDSRPTCIHTNLAIPQPSQQVTAEPLVHAPRPASVTPQPSRRVITEPLVHASRPASVTPQPSQRMTTEPLVHRPRPASVTPQPSQQMTTEPLVHAPQPASVTPQPSQRMTTEPLVHAPQPASVTPQPSQRMTTEPLVHAPWPVSVTLQPSQRVTIEPLVHAPWLASATPQPSQRATMEPLVHVPRLASATPQPSQQIPLPMPVNPTTGTFVLNLLQCCPSLGSQLLWVLTIVKIWQYYRKPTV